MGTISRGLVGLIMLATSVLATASCTPPPAQSAQSGQSGQAGQAAGAPATVTQTTAGPADSAILLTIFLRHDQSKTLGEIKEHLGKTEFTQNFPPPGVEVVSWYVMMGIGQVVTLRVPPDKLREVNLACEQRAWGAYRTEFYATYDYRPIYEAERKRLAGASK